MKQREEVRDILLGLRPLVTASIRQRMALSELLDREPDGSISPPLRTVLKELEGALMCLRVRFEEECVEEILP